LAHGAGKVRPEFAWAALDCPTAFACDPDGTPIVLARLTGVSIRRSVSTSSS
jgi:hypothetical protein